MKECKSSKELKRLSCQQWRYSSPVGSSGTAPLSAVAVQLHCRQYHSFVTSVLDGGERSTSRPDRLGPRKEAPFTESTRLIGPQNRCIASGGIRKLDLPVHSLVTTPTTLARLRCTGVDLRIVRCQYISLR